MASDLVILIVVDTMVIVESPRFIWGVKIHIEKEVE